VCFLVERRFGVGHGIWGGLGLDGVLWEVHGVYWKGKGVDMVWYGHGLDATNNGQAVHMCDSVTPQRATREPVPRGRFACQKSESILRSSSDKHPNERLSVSL